MERFDFFFGLNLGGRLHSHRPIIYLRIFRVLRCRKVAAVSGQGLAMANLTKETLTKMPSGQSFDNFYATISRKREGLLGKPTLPRIDALRPDWRLVLVHQANPKLPKITLEGSIVRILILSSVLSIRKASVPTPRWRPSWLKLLMVTTVRQSSCFLKHHTEKMLIQGRYLGMQLSILEVML